MQEKMFIHAGFFFSRNPSIHFFLKEANHVWRDCGTCAIVQADLTPPGHLKEGHGLDMVGYPLFLLVRIAYDLKQSPFPQASVAWTSSIAIGSIKLHPPFWFVILCIMAFSFAEARMDVGCSHSEITPNIVEIYRPLSPTSIGSRSSVDMP